MFAVVVHETRTMHPKDFSNSFLKSLTITLELNFSQLIRLLEIMQRLFEEVYSVQFNFLLANLMYLKQSWQPTDSLTDDTLNFFKTVNPILIANLSQKNDRISCTNKCKTLKKTTRPKHLITLLIMKSLLN